MTRKADPNVKHPAKFSKTVIDKIREILDRLTADWEYQPSVLDPFAGVGGIHHLKRNDDNGNHYYTLGVEIEPEWVAAGRVHGTMVCADFFQFEWHDQAGRWPNGPEIICTSPTYGNRFADKHNAKDGSTRRSYTHDLGRQLTANNSGGLQWGKKYRSFHRRAWQRCFAMLVPGGIMVLNVSDHVRGKEVVPVAAWHLDTMLMCGFELVEEHKIETPRMRMGQNHQARVEYEMIYVFRKPE